MSHDETGDHLTRYRKKQKAERKIWTAAALVRTDWSAEQCIEDLERRARGYSGMLCELLCTSAQRLRDAQLEINNLHEEIDHMAEELNAVAEDAAGESI